MCALPKMYVSECALPFSGANEKDGGVARNRRRFSERFGGTQILQRSEYGYLFFSVAVRLGKFNFELKTIESFNANSKDFLLKVGEVRWKSVATVITVKVRLPTR